jgi:hypothetical protein
MVRLGRRASLPVAFSLLVSAATAYAECAWVLWQEQTYSSINERARPDTRATLWVIASATSSEQNCRAAMAAATLSEQTAALPGGVSPLIEPPPYIAKYRGVCLPDTVDPRGAKGK